MIKFLLIAVLVLLYASVDLILNLLVFDPIVYWAKFLLLGLITRFILFLAGFYYIEGEQVTRKRGEKLKSGTSTHLIVCNHSSYLDYIYLQFRYNPIFLNVALDGGIYETGMLAGVWNSSRDAPTPSPTNLDDFLKSYRFSNPIVLFPEGTTTNGRGLLEFGIDLSQISAENVRIDVVGLKYVWSNCCPCFTTGSILGHFWTILNQVLFISITTVL